MKHSERDADRATPQDMWITMYGRVCQPQEKMCICRSEGLARSDYEKKK
jgi:hypothetical protein